MAKETTKESAEKQNFDINDVISAAIIQPRISEKSGQLAKMGKYVFVVPISTNKVEIKKAIERAYKVRVTQVNIVKTDGKLKTAGRTTYRTSDLKKAIVTLKDGDKISGFSDLA